MSIYKRRIVTILFILLFLVLAPLIVFYANGNILGRGWNILATGGIFIRSIKVGSNLYLNEKLVSNISFYNRNYLLKNLKPGLYTVQIKKEGYTDWTNKIKVYPSLVSESNVFMLPMEVEITEVNKLISTEKTVSSTTKKTFKANPDYQMVKSLFDDTDAPGRYLSVLSTTTGQITKYSLGKKENPIKDGHSFVWFENKNVFMGWDGGNDSSPKIFCDQTDTNFECRDLLKIYSFDEEVRNLDFFPGEAEVVISAAGKYIYAVEAENNPDKELLLIYSGVKPDFRILNNVIYISDSGLFKKVEI